MYDIAWVHVVHAFKQLVHDVPFVYIFKYIASFYNIV
mgnify:CR=1 FL=1